jgi:hypothetical protein
VIYLYMERFADWLAARRGQPTAALADGRGTA